MRTVKPSAIVIVCACVLLVNGCGSELQDQRTQNDTQQMRIDELQAELAANNLQLEQMKKQLAATQQKDSIEIETLQQKIAAQEEDLAKKQDLIASPQQSTSEAATSKEISLKTEMEKVSYVIGTQIGQSFKKQGIEINLESLIMGIKDILAGKELALSTEESQKVMTSFRQRMMAKLAAEKEKQAAEMAKLAPKNLAEGKAFLEANKTKEGVQVLPSGLQYKVITEGTGEIPTAEDKVRTHYRGTLINGTEFDSSYKRNKPAEFPVKGVIPGWTEALQLMKVGSKWELYIPANLAYGEKGRPGIPPNSTLIFEIELLEIVKAAEPAEAVK